MRACVCGWLTHPSLLPTEESGSDEDFMVDDDDDSDYGRSRKKSKKVIRRSRPERKEKKSPKPRLKATGEAGQECCCSGKNKKCVLHQIGVAFDKLKVVVRKLDFKMSQCCLVKR